LYTSDFIKIRLKIGLIVLCSDSLGKTLKYQESEPIGYQPGTSSGVGFTTEGEKASQRDYFLAGKNLKAEEDVVGNLRLRMIGSFH
jgi:hypothetical protein